MVMTSKDKMWSKLTKRNNLSSIRLKHLHIKRTVFNHYSNGNMECTCCGESEFKFLSLDHEDNKGYEHRKTQRGGIHLYKLLIKSGFPKGYTVLCMNCNFGKGQNNGICPHKD